jgi:plasmid replication initiation protein|tara:strand:- start:85 stop:852 length:768 start_codon:yes stop_codon:yes gene_type:complete
MAKATTTAKDLAEHSYTQENSLLTAHYACSMKEKRLLQIGMSKLNPTESYLTLDKDAPPTITVTVDDWVKAFGGVVKANAYRDLTRAADMLYERSVHLHPKDGKEKFRWFERSRFDAPRGVVDLTFTYSAARRLVGMENNFTSTDLLSVEGLKRLSSIRLYELAKSIIDVSKSRKKLTGHQTMSVDDFRYMTDCVEKYPRFPELKRCVIDPAMREVSLKTDLTITAKYEKAMRNVVRIQWTVKDNDQPDMFNGAE